MRSEFEFIDHIKKSYGLSSVGDDCAVLPKDSETDLVVTADMLAEDVDFRLKWTDPLSLGHKSLAVSLSDIAAMGAKPKWAMLSIGAPETIWNSRFLDDFYSGWHQLAERFAVELVGGDVSRVPDKLVIDSIVGGEVAAGKAVLRSGAKPGDVIFVSAGLGGAAAGLKLLESAERDADRVSTAATTFIEKQLWPTPQIELGQFLSINRIASAMIDISDGLASDLGHICKASDVGAVLDQVPFDRRLLELFSKEESSEFALHGGEDFELLFTVPPKKLDALAFGGLTRIGTVTSDSQLIELVHDGSRVHLSPMGFQHFS